jgi:hypothetical protein
MLLQQLSHTACEGRGYHTPCFAPPKIKNSANGHKQCFLRKQTKNKLCALPYYNITVTYGAASVVEGAPPPKNVERGIYWYVHRLKYFAKMKTYQQWNQYE